MTAFSPAGSWRTAKDYEAVSKPFRIIYFLLPLLMVLVWLFLRIAAVRRFLNKQAMEYGDRVPHADVYASMRSMRKTHILPGLLTSMGVIGAIKPWRVESNIPVLIAWCEQDKVIPFETYGTAMLEAIDGAETVIVKGVGHVPMYDDPAQVAALILQTAGKAEAQAA